MKNIVKIAALSLAVAVLAASCTKSDIKGFKKTADGLHYKFEQRNSKGAAIHVGDVIVGELVFRLDTIVLASNVGNPARILTIRDSVFKGYNIDEGLLMMRTGEKAVFAIYADSVARYFGPQQLPPFYKPGTDMIYYYEVRIDTIVSRDEILEEQENFRQAMDQRKHDEPEIIAQYIADNNIKVKPNDEGLYVIVNKMGNGPTVAVGRNVQINYTGRLLDGRIFDTSVESDAREAGLYQERRNYEPLSYKVGEMGLIKGWEDGVMGLPQGSRVTLIIPSELGYGERGAGDLIEPNTPLRFDLEIVSVK